MELSEYTDVIKKLSQLYNDPDFNVLFDNLMLGESKSNRFLIKMEVNRISAPTRRILDFRDHNDKDVMRFEYKGITHHLSATEIALLKKLLEQHQGHYTLGTYEDIQAFHQAERSKPRDEREVVADDTLDGYAVDAIDYGTYFVRNEERMHYSTLVRTLFGGDTETMDLMTSDVSTSGLRIKVDKHLSFKIGVEVGINFVGLRQEFANNFLRDFFGYTLMGIDQESKFNYLRLKRNSEHTELNIFINKLIIDNKHKYKVNVRYQEENIVVKGYEQFFLPRMSGLPVYISESDTTILSHVLLNENNRSVYDYWSNEDAKSQFEACFQTKWMLKALANKDLVDTYIYSFYYSQKGRLFFYAVSLEELEATGLKELFLSFASQRPNFRVFKLVLHNGGFDKQKHLIDVNSYKQKIQPFAMQELEAISRVGLLQDVTNEAILDDYKLGLQDGVDFNQLHQFRLPQAQQSAILSKFKFVQLRKEARFSYKTAIVASTSEQSVKGWSNDFSTEGLQIELEMPMDVKVGQRIYVELPNLQKIAKHQVLVNLPYGVVGSNQAKTKLHLHISGSKEDHPARQFFRILIDSNKDKLRSSPEPRQAPGVTSVLRNIYCQYLSTTPLYVHKVNKHYVLDKVGISQCKTTLTPLLAKFGTVDSPYSTYPLLGDDTVRGVVESTLESLSPTQRPSMHILYVGVAHSDCELNIIDKTVVKAKFEQDFEDIAARKLFIENAMKSGDFFAIQIMMSRTGRPDMEYIEKELNYVNHYASHRTQKLEEALWSVQGVADLIDITPELLFRLGLKP